MTQYRVRNSQTFALILYQINLVVYGFHCYFLTANFNIVRPSVTRSSRFSLSFSLLKKSLQEILLWIVSFLPVSCPSLSLSHYTFLCVSCRQTLRNETSSAVGVSISFKCLTTAKKIRFNCGSWDKIEVSFLLGLFFWRFADRASQYNLSN